MKTEYIGYKHYCPYCGSEAKEDVDYHEYDRIVTYFCDCEGYKIDKKAQEQYDKLMNSIPYRKNIREHFAQLRYNHELMLLRQKYRFDLKFDEFDD